MPEPCGALPRGCSSACGPGLGEEVWASVQSRPHRLRGAPGSLWTGLWKRPLVTRPRLQMGSPDRLRPGPPRPPPASAGNGRAPFSCCVLPAPPTEKAYRRAPSKGVPAQSTRRPLTVHSELGGSKLMTDTDCIQTLDRTPLKQLTGKGADLNHCSKQCFAWKS